MSTQRNTSTILVTGGTGYIGSHTVVELLNAGYKVVVADNFSNSRPEVLDALKHISGIDIPFIQTDFTDPGQVQALFSQKNFDAIIHFAAYKSVNESVLHPDEYYKNNMLSLMHLLEAALAHNCKKIVFSSSCSVYGEPDQLPVSESTPLKRAESPYAFTKQVGERILQDYAHQDLIECILLRYFNPAGAHPSGLIGEYPLQQPNNLVPVIMQTAIGLRTSMDVFGSDYDTPDGSCVRDYIHVEDVATAHVKAIDRLLSKVSQVERCEVYNLGTGKGNTVLEVISTFESVCKQKLNYQLKGRREGDVVKVYADASLAHEKLGWTAKKSLEDILRSAWNWELALKNKTEQQKALS